MFYLVAILLGLIAAVFVLLPVLLKPRSASDERDAINLALYKDRISELQADENLPEEEFKRLELEAQRDLLTDTSGAGNSPVEASGRTRVLLVASLLVPLLALFLYSDLGIGRGSISDVTLSQLLREADPAHKSSYRRVVAQLEERAAEKPGNTDLQFLLARTYSNLGEHQAAAERYELLLETFPADSNLASFYAESLFMIDGRKLTARVDAAIDKTLHLNPNDLTMLELKGIGSINGGDMSAAVSWFERALATGVTGERAQLIRHALARLQPGGAATNETGTPEASGRVLNVAVSAASNIDLPANTAVFVYATATGGPPAPLAVQKITLGRLPVTVRLDETMAMMPGMGLANFDEVNIIARISIRGDVVPSPGDYEARLNGVSIAESPVDVALAIKDQIDAP